VVGFGALNVDMIYRLHRMEEAGFEPGVETFGEPGDLEEMMLRLQSAAGPPVTVCAGGSAANTVYALHRMGFRTGFVGAVGEDPEAGMLLEGLGDPGDLVVLRKGASGTTVIAVGPDGDRGIAVFPNANDELRTGDVDTSLLSRARVVHLTAFVGDGAMEAQLRAVEYLPEGTIVTLDPGNLYANRGIGALEPLLSRSSVVFPGEAELLTLTGETDRVTAAATLLELGADTVVCKLGPKGIHTFWEGDDHILWAQPVVPVGDSVGAGDVAAAGYITGLLKGLPRKACTALAHACAVESLSGNGRESYPDEEVLEGLLSDLED
jgi:ribokinase